MTEQDWYALCTNIDSSNEEIRFAMLGFADWAEENGKDYYRGLRFLHQYLITPRQFHLKIHPIEQNKYRIYSKDMLAPIMRNMLSTRWEESIMHWAEQMGEKVGEPWAGGYYDFLRPEDILIAIARGTQDYLRWVYGV